MVNKYRNKTPDRWSKEIEWKHDVESFFRWKEIYGLRKSEYASQRLKALAEEWPALTKDLPDNLK